MQQVETTYLLFLNLNLASCKARHSPQKGNE